jgi:mannose-6-phosphate isomerase-like protein (cupin superfamily)
MSPHLHARDEAFIVIEGEINFEFHDGTATGKNTFR